MSLRDTARAAFLRWWNGLDEGDHTHLPPVFPGATGLPVRTSLHTSPPEPIPELARPEGVRLVDVHGVEYPVTPRYEGWVDGCHMWRIDALPDEGEWGPGSPDLRIDVLPAKTGLSFPGGPVTL